MELLEQLCQQAETAETLACRITELRQAQTSAGATDPLFAETLRSLTARLEEAQQSLRLLRRRHDQQMLSQMVKEGPANAGTMAWWMNRY